MNKIIVLLFVTLLFINCGDDEGASPEDLEKPQMEIITPIQNASYSRGDELLLSGVFTDDLALKALEVTLIPPATTKSLKGLDIPWDPGSESISLSGTSQKLNAKLLFNESIPFNSQLGGYVLNFKLIDDDGKQTMNTITIVIE